MKRRRWIAAPVFTETSLGGHDKTKAATKGPSGGQEDRAVGIGVL